MDNVLDDLNCIISDANELIGKIKSGQITDESTQEQTMQAYKILSDLIIQYY